MIVKIRKQKSNILNKEEIIIVNEVFNDFAQRMIDKGIKKKTFKWGIGNFLFINYLFDKGYQVPQEAFLDGFRDLFIFLTFKFIVFFRIKTNYPFEKLT